MLVLSRHKDESIVINDDIVITVVEIRGDKIRLGITAPKHVQVHREEVYEEVKREERAVGDVPETDAEATLRLFARQRRHQADAP